ncbi:hypothetical protein KEM48_007834 [Puccinia striiformis f. sp. tritici PST-130]|nr:hypothetical protein KEM48_007834 [Puccinia striiformis f. sp. tritici PST-130]
MVQCFRLHRILMFFLFGAKVRKSAQCKLGSQGVLGEREELATIKRSQGQLCGPNERSKSISSLNSYLTETNQESQNLKEYASPLSQAGSKDVSSGEVVPTTSQSPEDRSHKNSRKNLPLTQPSIHQAHPPTCQRPQLRCRQLSPDLNLTIKSSKGASSSRMRLGSRSWFKKKKKLNCPPQWWTQFQVNSQRSHAEASSINEFFDEGANPTGRTLDQQRIWQPNTNQLSPDGMCPQNSTKVKKYWTIQKVNGNSARNLFRPADSRNWLRGTNGMRGTVFLATAAIRKDPNLFLKRICYTTWFTFAGSFRFGF